jgi:hypothetical protein
VRYVRGYQWGRLSINRHCASHSNSSKCVLDDDDAAKAAAVASTSDGALNIDDAACSPCRDTAGHKRTHASDKPNKATIIDDDDGKADNAHL